MKKILKIFMCATRGNVGIRHDKDFLLFEKWYGEDRVISHRGYIGIKLNDNELYEILYKSIKSETLDGYSPNEFEIDASASMTSSLEDIERVLKILRTGHVGVE